MRKASLKPVIRALFCVITAMSLSVCIQDPVNLKGFAEDAQDLLNTERVKLTGSDTGLTAGNGRITGLNPNKYYMIEEWDDTGVFIGTQIVTAAGTRNANLQQIGKVSGSTITGLTNGFTYRVRSAAALTGSQDFYDDTANPPSSTALNKTVPSIGEIELSEPVNNYYLNVLAYSGGDFLEFPILPTPNPTGIVNGSSGYIQLINTPGAASEYLFVTGFSTGVEFPATGKFNYLKVTIEDGGNSGNVNITFSLTNLGAGLGLVGSPTLSVTVVQLTAATPTVITLSFNTSTIPASSTLVSYQWLYNSTTKNGGSFVFSEAESGAFVNKGKHTITLRVVLNTGTFTRDFVIEVTD